VRSRTGIWMAAATLAVYWGLAGAGLLLRALNDPSIDLAEELFEQIGWSAYPTSHKTLSAGSVARSVSHSARASSAKPMPGTR
jgi:hypothetical protein